MHDPYIASRVHSIRSWLKKLIEDTSLLLLSSARAAGVEELVTPRPPNPGEVIVMPWNGTGHKSGLLYLVWDLGPNPHIYSKE